MKQKPEHGSPEYAALVDRDIELIVMMVGGFALAVMVGVVSVIVRTLFGNE